MPPAAPSLRDRRVIQRRRGVCLHGGARGTLCARREGRWAQKQPHQVGRQAVTATSLAHHRPPTCRQQHDEQRLAGRIALGRRHGAPHRVRRWQVVGQLRHGGSLQRCAKVAHSTQGLPAEAMEQRKAALQDARGKVAGCQGHAILHLWRSKWPSLPPNAPTRPATCRSMPCSASCQASGSSNHCSPAASTCGGVGRGSECE